MDFGLVSKWRAAGEPIMTNLIKDKDGNRRWYLNGKPHRTDGPAIEYADGSKEWWLNGKWHRADGPAVEYADGTKFWYFDGELHRVDKLQESDHGQLS